MNVYFPKTHTVRAVDMVTFSPTMVNRPHVTSEDHLRKAESDTVRILTNPSEKLKEKCNTSEVYQALLELGKIFGTAEKIPTIEDLKMRANT